MYKVTEDFDSIVISEANEHTWFPKYEWVEDVDLLFEFKMASQTPQRLLIWKLYI